MSTGMYPCLFCHSRHATVPADHAVEIRGCSLATYRIDLELLSLRADAPERVREYILRHRAELKALIRDSEHRSRPYILHGSDVPESAIGDGSESA
jgi:hypothetical protein